MYCFKTDMESEYVFFNCIFKQININNSVPFLKIEKIKSNQTKPI